MARKFNSQCPDDVKEVYEILKNISSIRNNGKHNSGKSHVQIRGLKYSVDHLRFCGGHELFGIYGPGVFDSPEKDSCFVERKNLETIDFSISDRYKVTGRIPENIFQLLGSGVKNVGPICYGCRG